MSNGMAYVLDPYGDLPSRMNHDLVEIQPMTHAEDIELLKVMIERHYERTGSRRAEELLSDWAEALPKFRKIAPRPVPGQDDPMDEVRRQLRSLEELEEELGLVNGEVPVEVRNVPSTPSLSTP
jgi:glutamate synthase domain-containing protein 3